MRRATAPSAPKRRLLLLLVLVLLSLVLLAAETCAQQLASGDEQDLDEEPDPADCEVSRQVGPAGTGAETFKALFEVRGLQRDARVFQKVTLQEGGRLCQLAVVALELDEDNIDGVELALFSAVGDRANSRPGHLLAGASTTQAEPLGAGKLVRTFLDSAINLPAGEYWVGVRGVTAFAVNGEASAAVDALAHFLAPDPEAPLPDVFPHHVLNPWLHAGQPLKAPVFLRLAPHDPGALALPAPPEALCGPNQLPGGNFTASEEPLCTLDAENGLQVAQQLVVHETGRLCSFQFRSRLGEGTTTARFALYARDAETGAVGALLASATAILEVATTELDFRWRSIALPMPQEDATMVATANSTSTSPTPVWAVARFDGPAILPLVQGGPQARLLEGAVGDFTPALPSLGLAPPDCPAAGSWPVSVSFEFDIMAAAASAAPSAAPQATLSPTTTPSVAGTELSSGSPTPSPTTVDRPAPTSAPTASSRSPASPTTTADPTSSPSSSATPSSGDRQRRGAALASATTLLVARLLQRLD